MGGFPQMEIGPFVLEYPLCSRKSAQLSRIANYFSCYFWLCNQSADNLPHLPFFFVYPDVYFDYAILLSMTQRFICEKNLVGVLGT